MTEEQKTARRERMNARKAARDQQWKQEQADRALIGEAMRKILANDESTTREKVFAALTLDNVTIGTLIPWKASQLYDHDVDIGDFRRELEEIKAAENAT